MDGKEVIDQAESPNKIHFNPRVFGDIYMKSSNLTYLKNFITGKPIATD
jgi:hypothetical protein